MHAALASQAPLLVDVDVLVAVDEAALPPAPPAPVEVEVVVPDALEVVPTDVVLPPVPSAEKC
jgi:hypothetical protein